MPTPTIINGQEHFFNVTYEGNGGGMRVGNFIPFTDQATIANSLIFNHNDTTQQLQRAAPASAGNQKTFTISCWFKRAKLGDQQYLWSIWNGTHDASNYDSSRLYIQIESTGVIELGAWNSYIKTNRTFEDTSKFYHLLIAVDTTQSTASDRMKMYVDGEQITSFSGSSYFPLNQDTAFAKRKFTIGNTASGDNAQETFDGYVAEFNAIEGQALTPASFGITDTSTGRWIPKTVEPFPTTTTDIAVTVVSSGGNKYALDGVTQDTVTLIEGATYKFDQSDSSNSGHPLRFSTTSDGTHGSGSEYTTGVTTVGTPGSSGAYTQITVAVGAPTLYYYCSNHSGMGGTANTQDQYGTNGFRLKFQDSSALGDDTSGNGNDFTGTNLVAGDQTTDSPTQNFATLTPNRMKSGFTLSEGNLKLVSNTTDGLCMSGMRVSGGKFYIETEVDAFTNGGSQGIGFCEETLSTSTDPSGTADVFGIFSNQTDFVVLRDGAYSQDNGGALAAGNIVQIAFDGSDLGNAKFYLGINNSKWYYEDMSENSSFDATRPTLTLDLRARTNLRFYVGNRASTGSPGSSTFICNFGQKSYSYTAPTGFGSFNQDALPETGKGITGLYWVKNRDASANHYFFDSSRGRTKLLQNTSDAESERTDAIQKFLKGGVSLEDFGGANTSGNSFIGWNWVANGGTTASNTTGSITSTVQANTTAGFSIVQYTGNGTQGATVGHGLSSAPEWILIKVLTSHDWQVYHKSVGATKSLQLNQNSAPTDNAGYYNDTSPTSSVFSVGANTYRTNDSSSSHIAYVWTGIPGYSKFGSYTGNANTNGPFVFLGFKPAWCMVKNISTSGTWVIWDLSLIHI